MVRPRPRVLSISSDETVLDTRNRVLTFAGFEVVGCLQAISALEIFRNASFDAVILGDSMPPGMGLIVLRGLKEMSPNVPVVVIHLPGELTEQMQEADAVCGSLDGPERLISTVASVLGFSPKSAHVPLRRSASAS
jgi:DNA-binding NtrC family response regulator